MGMGIAAVAVLVSLSVVVAYMSWRTWPPTQVVLLVLIFWTSIGFVYLAARTLKTHQAWRTTYRQLEGQVAQVEEQNLQLRKGTKDGDQVTPGIEQLQGQLSRLIIERGGTWFEAQAKNPDPETGAVELEFKGEAPHHIVPKMILVAFDTKDVKDGGKYLGRFVVTEVTPKNVKVTPLPPPGPDDKQELAAIAGSSGTWNLYASMPVDNPRIFAAMDQKQRDSMLPNAPGMPQPSDKDKKVLPVPEEYASADRVIRDYAKFFEDFHLKRIMLRDAMIEVQSKIARTLAAIEKTKQDIAARQAEKQALAFDLKHFALELQIVAAYEQALRSQLATFASRVADTLKTNLELVAQLTAAQVKAADEIDRRTEEPRPSASIPAAGR